MHLPLLHADDRGDCFRTHHNRGYCEGGLGDEEKKRPQALSQPQWQEEGRTQRLTGETQGDAQTICGKNTACCHTCRVR